MDRLPVATSAASMLPTVCTSHTENGELVQRHFGYVTVTTPTFVKGEHPLQIPEAEATGTFCNLYRREGNARVEACAALDTFSTVLILSDTGVGHSLTQ